MRKARCNIQDILQQEEISTNKQAFDKSMVEFMVGHVMAPERIVQTYNVTGFNVDGTELSMNEAQNVRQRVL